MLQLPVELRRVCISFLDHVVDEVDETVDTLKQLRLVSKEIGAIATEFLFGTAVLRSLDPSAKVFQQLVRSAFSHLVRRVVIYTDCFEDDPQDESTLDESFAEAIGTLSIFENLQELQLKFAVQCAAEPDSYFGGGYLNDVNETPEYRSAVLKVVFEALQSVRTLRVLSIRNLQDHMDRRILKADAFQSVRSRLTSLHLQIATEERKQRELDCAAIHRGFTVDLPELWLSPMATHLTHLTLYCYSAMWGIYPFVDFRQVQTFPCLESLSFGNWTIAHDWQIDWIVSHGATLKQLLLDDCPIVVALRMAGDDDMAQLNFPGLQPLPGEDWAPYFALVPLRWREVFEKFRSNLHQLEHFAMYGTGGNHDWFEDSFEHRYSLENALRPGRYHTFNRGMVPPWDDFKDPRWAKHNVSHEFFRGRPDHPDPNHRLVEYPACDDEDLAALRKMLEVVRMRGRNVM
jgi:hypothetical protein